MPPSRELTVLRQRIDPIVYNVQTRFGTSQQYAQVMCVAEEAGEFVKYARRYLGLARTQRDETTFVDMSAELADIVISAITAARVFNVDLQREIDLKLGVIEDRGGF